MKHEIKHNKNSGFTIVETIVSLAIFSFSIVGLITVSARGISDSSMAKNRLTATYLAQEGLELVRNKRDTAIIADSANGWLNFQDSTHDCDPGQGGCDIDPINEAVYKCSTGSCIIQEVTDTGYYGHVPVDVSSTNTIFKRVITLEEPGDWGGNTKDEYQMTVTVTWTQGISPQSVKLVENIYNWQ